MLHAEWPHSLIRLNILEMRYLSYLQLFTQNLAQTHNRDTHTYKYTHTHTSQLKWIELIWSIQSEITQLCPTHCNPMVSVYSPWNSPGKNTGVWSLSLLQGIFPTQGLNPGLPHCKQILYQLSHKGSPRILEWVAYPFSRGSSWPRHQTWVSCIAGRFFTNWAIREAQYIKRGCCCCFF